MRMLTTVIVMALLFIAGCGSEFGTGAATGIGIGTLFQGTLAGAKADLETRELALVAAYNDGIAIGMEEESLDDIAKEIEWTRHARTGIDVGKQFLGLDWKNPRQTSIAFGSLMELALIIWGGKKLFKTAKELKGMKAGVAKFSGLSDVETASRLHDTIKSKVNTT